MNKQTRKTELLHDGLIAAPGCPFTAGALFGDLRSRLAKEHRRPMSYERLARIMGQSTTTTHHWFGLFHQSPHQRQVLPRLRTALVIVTASADFHQVTLPPHADMRIGTDQFCQTC
jgi:hypothetical protein